MASLKVNFAEGDILTAGVITSTSSMNGITTTVNSNTLTKLAYLGSSTLSTVADYTLETNIGEVLIPANTISTGIIVQAGISVQGISNDSIFRLKIGPTSSEATKQTVPLVTSTSDSQDSGGAILYYDSTQTWTSDVTVIVTAAMSGASGANDESTCYGIIVTGY